MLQREVKQSLVSDLSTSLTGPPALADGIERQNQMETVNPLLFKEKSPLERKQVLLRLSANILPFVGAIYACIVKKFFEADEDCYQ
jgi:hypothetical protein